MARRIKNSEEEDAFTRWRHYLYWRPGQRKAVKRRASRRERREGKQEAKSAKLEKFARQLWPVPVRENGGTRPEELTGQQQPHWTQGLKAHVTAVLLICGLPLSPALLALLIIWLCR